MCVDEHNKTSSTRAVITGIGVISPIGLNPQEFNQSITDGRCGIGPISHFDASVFRCQVGGEVKNFQPTKIFSEEDLDDYDDPYLLMGLAAAKDALKAAGLPDDLSNNRRIAVSVGTCNGGLRTAELLYKQLHGLAPGHLTPKMNLIFRYFALGRALACRFKIGGPNVVVTTACASSTNAVGYALDLIQSGRADVVLTGGADALCLTTLSGFCGVRATTNKNSLCTPFSGHSDSYGINLGEGAAFWVVESLAHARNRGAEILGEILGYSLTGDAYHLTSPDPRGDGAYRAMSNALSRADLEVGELASINAHGTGTKANDIAESKAVTRLLKGTGKSVPISSTKSFFGHCLGAAGILEATASLLQLRDGRVPPTLRFSNARPGCNLDYIPERGRSTQARAFLSNSFAFSGNNASIAVGLPSDSRKKLKISKHSVVITGAGTISALGVGVQALVEGLTLGRSGVRRIERFDTSALGSHYAGLVKDLDWRRVGRRLGLQTMNPISRYATIAAREALEQADYSVSPRAMKDVGLVLGVFVGPSEEVLMNQVWGTPDHVPHVGNFSEIVANSLNGYVSKALYLKGYNSMISPGYQAALGATLAGAQAISLGHQKSILVGGSDEVFPQYFFNYESLGYLATGEDELHPGHRTLKDHRRILGEGSAMLFLESRKAAQDRGATILAEILGWAESCDPGPFVFGTEHYEGLVYAIKETLLQGSCDPKEVAAVVSSPIGNSWDQREFKALVAVFGESGSDPCDNGVPPVLHTVPATGYAESATTLMATAALVGGKGWPERFPERTPGALNYNVLVIGTSAMGNNHVMLIRV